MYYSLLQSTILYYKVVLRPKRRQNDVHPVLLRTTKYYSSTTPYYKVLLQYYKVLPRTTKYYSSTTPYYKVLLQYYKVLLCTTKYYSSTTPYYDVLLQYYSVLQTYCSVLQSTTPTETTSERRPSSTTPYYKVLLQYCFVLQSTTPYYKVLLHVLLLTTKYYSVLQSTTSTETTSERRPSSTTPYYKVLLQYYSVLQSTTPVLQSTTSYYKVLLQYYSVLQTYYSSTTPYYKVLLQYYKVLLCTAKYYSSTTSTETTSERRPSSTTPYYKVLLQYYKVLPRTTKYYSSTTPYYKVLLQYYSVLQTYYKVLLRTTEYYSSTTPYYKVVQKLPKRAFRARLPQLFKEQASKTSISCETSSTFQRTSFQNEYFVRDFRNFSSDKLPKRAFRARLPQLFKEQASKTSISCEASSTFQGTSFQNEHFVRGFLNFSIKELPKSCACHAKRENDLSPWKFEASKRAFRARLPPHLDLKTKHDSLSSFRSRFHTSCYPSHQTLMTAAQRVAKQSVLGSKQLVAPAPRSKYEPPSPRTPDDDSCTKR